VPPPSLATVSTPLPPPEPPPPDRIRKPTEEKPGPVGTLTADDGTMHPLLEDDLTIGRTGNNGIALKDASVSANHARVVRGAEGFTIEDIGSRNGTFVNGDKISEKRLLADGDLVRLGKVILTFNLAAEVKREDATQVEKI
jgi:pSer/pThr/pTyr-binding forkhead associated (FHA) protein